MNKSRKEIENEKTRGRKRYLERVQETTEAEKDIKEYENRPDEGGANRRNGIGPFDRECSEGKF